MMMNKMRNGIVVALVALFALGMSQNASAQFRWGLMAGATFNKTPLNVAELKDAQYMTGFQIGPVVEYGFNLGTIGIAAEGGLLFTQRGAKFQDSEKVKEVFQEAFDTFKSNYVEVPLSAKLYFTVAPAVKLFVKAGPSFNVNITRQPLEIDGKAIAQLPNGYKKNSLTVALNAGLGVEVLRFLQISALYSASMTPDYQFKSIKSSGQDFIDAKNKGFILSAALLF